MPIFWREAPSDATPVLYVHGVPDSSDNWVPFLERAGGIAVDLPGFGRSAKRGDLDFSIAGYDRFLEHFLDHLDVDRLRLVVHDWGAAALAFAQRFPERIERLVVVDAVPLLPGYRWHPTARVWRVPLLGEALMGATSSWSLRRLADRRPAAMPAGSRRRRLEPLRRRHPARDPAPLPQRAARRARARPVRASGREGAGARPLRRAGSVHPGGALRVRLRGGAGRARGARGHRRRRALAVAGPARACGSHRRLRYGVSAPRGPRAAVEPVLVAAAIAAAYLIAAPASADLAAQEYRVALARDQGPFTLWDGGWFGGHHTLGYSVLYPPLGALMGARVVGALAAVAAAGLFALLVERRWGERARLGALWFAAGAGAWLFTGRLTFLLGVAVGLGRAARRPARTACGRPAARGPDAARQPRRRAVPGARRRGVGDGAGSARSNGIAIAVAALAPILLLAIAFPEGGTQPFPARYV